MIELKAKSENFVPKTVLEELLAKVEAGDDFVQEHVDTLKDIIDVDYDVEIEVEEAAITMAAKTQRRTSELADELLPELDAYYIEEEYNDRALAKPLLASDFNAYDFKRKMCDLFETSYHVDSFDLVKMLAEKLQVDYLL